MSYDKGHLATRVIHAGQQIEPETGAIMPPIFLSSTYVQESPGRHKGYEYTRSHNPTRYALERMVAKLESSTIDESVDPSCGGFAFSSGMAAMATVLELLDAGSHVITVDDIYGGSNRLFKRVRQRTQGLKVDFIDMTKPETLEAHMLPDTSMIWVETPTNPTLKIVDLADIARRARAVNPNVLLVCDNTFASPMLQRPLEHGFDIVIHSVTKYLNGHSDVVGGMAVTNSVDLTERLRFLQNAVGSVLPPFDAYMTLRGIKTLSIRMERHTSNAMRVATCLEGHESVERVLYPGLPSHPQHELALRQMDGAGGMVTFFIKGGLDEAAACLESLEVFALAESLGGVESMVNHPAIMTHASVPIEMREALGISDTLIRLSVGIEDGDDLIADLDRALMAARTSAVGG